MERRVVITGCGVVTPAGCELDRFWSTLMRGERRLRPLTSLAIHDLPPLVGGEVELPAEDVLPEEVEVDTSRARCLMLTVAAVRRAIAHARLPSDRSFREATGVAIGTAFGEERQVSELVSRAAGRGGGAEESLDAGFFARAAGHRLASVCAGRYGLGGPVMLHAAACSSGNAAIASAYELVRMGAADCMIAGAADALVRSIHAWFARTGALSNTTGRPFDRLRDGVSFGEGAGIVVLEELESARRRGARIQAEVAGFGLSHDAHHISAPEPTGEGVTRAIQQALRTSDTSAAEVDWICAHAAGMPAGDRAEVRAIRTVFGERAHSIPMSAIKSSIGHTNGAASAIEAVACVLALERQEIPPTAGVLERDPELDVDCVQEIGRSMKVRTCLNLSAGLGGFNACLVLRGVQ